MDRAKGETARSVPNGQALTHDSHKQSAKPKHAKKGAPEYSLINSIHASEKHVLGGQHYAHALEVSLIASPINSGPRLTYRR